MIVANTPPRDQDEPNLFSGLTGHDYRRLTAFRDGVQMGLVQTTSPIDPRLRFLRWLHLTGRVQS